MSEAYTSICIRFASEWNAFIFNKTVRTKRPRQNDHFFFRTYQILIILGETSRAFFPYIFSSFCTRENCGDCVLPPVKRRRWVQIVKRSWAFSFEIYESDHCFFAVMQRTAKALFFLCLLLTVGPKLCMKIAFNRRESSLLKFRP